VDLKLLCDCQFAFKKRGTKNTPCVSIKSKDLNGKNVPDCN